MTSAATPRALGFRMPAEWEPHEATWLSWPRRDGISFPDRYEAIPAIWGAMVAALSHGELVHVSVTDAAQEAEVRAVLAAVPGLHGDHVFLHRIPTNEPWCRDHGPTFVVRNSELAIVDWRYNAWGGKYPPWDRDDQVPARVAELLGVRRFDPGIVMEGGALDVNGRGTVLTTESCLLNPNRNPSLGRAEIERYLREYLGANTIVWLGEGIIGDDTDGHVDDLTRFVGPRTVVTVVEADPTDDNHRLLADNVRRLRAARDQDNRPLEIVELSMPGVVEWEGQRLPASYANFYVGNDVVLVPTFAHANDAAALAILARCFSDRRVVGIDATVLVWGLGAFHCATQQQPAVGARVYRDRAAPLHARRGAGLSSAVSSRCTPSSPTTGGGSHEALLQPADACGPPALAARGDWRALRDRVSRHAERRAQEARLHEDSSARSGTGAG